VKAPPIPPGAVVVEEREIRPGVIERRYEYPSRARDRPLVTRIGGTCHLAGTTSRPRVPRSRTRFSPTPLPVRRDDQQALWEITLASSKIVSVIRRQIFLDADLGGTETGGFLLGRNVGIDIRIEDVSTPEPGDERGEAHMALSWDAAAWRKLWHHRDDGADVVGDWHFHPGGD